MAEEHIEPNAVLRRMAIHEHDQRRAMAAWLHTQVLGKLSLSVSKPLRKSTDPKDHAILEFLDEQMNLIRDKKEELWTSAFNLQGNALVYALNELLSDFADANNLPVTRVAAENSVSFPSYVELQIYCIIQDALAQATRHGALTAVTLELENDDDTLKLILTVAGYDGNFVPENPDALCIFDRAAMIGGELNHKLSSEEARKNELILQVNLRPQA